MAGLRSSPTGDDIIVETPGISRFQSGHISLLDTDTILFSVQADHGAHIALSTVPNNVNVLTYEIVMQVLT